MMAKVIVVRARQKNFMVLIPADQNLDLFKLSLAVDDNEVILEDSGKVHSLFPDCEPDAVPPLGKPFNIPCLMDETLLDGEHVLFYGGSRDECIQVSSDEFWRLTEAELGNFRSRPLSTLAS